MKLAELNPWARNPWFETVAEAQRESAEIWSGFSKVAAANPKAWLRKATEPQYAEPTQ